MDIVGVLAHGAPKAGEVQLPETGQGMLGAIFLVTLVVVVAIGLFLWHYIAGRRDPSKDLVRRLGEAESQLAATRR